MSKYLAKKKRLSASAPLLEKQEKITVKRSEVKPSTYQQSSKVKNKPSTLCWKCKKATGNSDCIWANKLKPRNDWEAEKTVILQYSGVKLQGQYSNDIVTQIESYYVKKCPGFEKDIGNREHYEEKNL